MQKKNSYVLYAVVETNPIQRGRLCKIHEHNQNVMKYFYTQLQASAVQRTSLFVKIT